MDYDLFVSLWPKALHVFLYYTPINQHLMATRLLQSDLWPGSVRVVEWLADNHILASCKPVFATPEPKSTKTFWVKTFTYPRQHQPKMMDN